MIDQIRKVVDAIQIKRHEVPLSRAILVGITGIDGCGKGYVTGLIVPECQRQGFKAIGINVDSWLNLPHKRFSKSHPAEYFYEHAIRFDEMFQQLVLPLKHKRQHSVSADLAEETAREYYRYTYRFENVDVLVLEGIYLLKSAYRNHFDLTVWVDCTFETALERALKRGQEGLAAAETVRAYQTIYFPAQQIHFANDHPRDAADLVIQNDPRLDGGTSAAAVDQFRQLKPYLFEGERPITPVAPQLKLAQATIVTDEMTCQDYSKSSHLEWLETNGLGSFASGTVSGANTRRYHGLLVASLHPPADRFVTLSKVEETFVLGDQRFELGANQYPFNVSPKGYCFIKEFSLSPFPCWVYDLRGLQLEKSVLMVHGENTTIIHYRLLNPGDSFAVLAVRPFVAFRDYHSLTVENANIQQNPARNELGLLELHPYDGLPTLKLHQNAVAFTVEPHWYRKFEYLEEMDRGLDFREDLFSYGYFSFELSAKSPEAFIVATLNDKARVTLSEVEAIKDCESNRRYEITSSLSSSDPFVQQLALAADSFQITRADRSSSVIAGYHWFTDWGRDTMISLPGLTLTTKRFDLARNILSSFLKYCDQGMLPNRFPDRNGAPEFNSVDATLWLFHAVHEYLKATNDLAFIRSEAYSKLDEVMEWYKKGTRYGIRMDTMDGLLSAGVPGVQLTWMDAKIGDWVVTPRQGKAVEINALWYNAMRVMESLSRQLNEVERASSYQQLADRIQQSFEHVFWNARAGCLYDCIQDTVADARIRPNQIFAVSLPFALLPPEKAKAVVQVVAEKLLTPYGLRSLASEDPEYRRVYAGNPYERDSAYHQGAVWAWLIGPFVDAYLNVHGESEGTCRYLESLLDGFKRHMSQAMLGSISEIFDADPPHAPKGCTAQAWSVAEVLRAVQKLRLLRERL